MRVLLLRETSGVGDVIRCTAVATAIRRALPQAHVDIRASDPYAGFASLCPDISRVLKAPFRKYGQPAPDAPRGYTHVVDLVCPAFDYERQAWPNITKDRVEAWTEAAARVLGVKLEPCRPHISIDETERRAGRGLLYRLKIDPKGARQQPLVGVAMESKDPLRRLTSKQMHALILRLKQAGCIVFGITAGMERDEFVGLVDQLDLMVTPDTGTLHLAGALGIPTVLVASTTEGGLLSRWYDEVDYINPSFSGRGCPGHCYYSGNGMYFQACRAAGCCERMAEIDPGVIADAAIRRLVRPETDDHREAAPADRGTAAEDTVAVRECALGDDLV